MGEKTMDAPWKAYLREVLAYQKEIIEEMDKANYDRAQELLKQMMERTERNIEDA